MKEANRKALDEIVSHMRWEINQKMGYTHKEIGKIVGNSSSDKWGTESTPTLASFITVIRELKPEETLQKICEIGGGIFVRIPEIEGDVAKILQGVSELGKEFSEVVAAVSKAIDPTGEGGSDITKREAKDLLPEIEDVIKKALLMKEYVQEIADGKHKV